MEGFRQYSFGPFRADLDAQCLWREAQSITLRPKTWEVLRYLIENPGRLITKDELLDRVWVDTIVTEGTLTQSIKELRSVLADDPKRPSFIATVHRRGYRFIAELTGRAVPRVSGLTPGPSSLVGRDRELAQLEEVVAAAVRGQRNCVFVTGDPGIGKTTLLDELQRVTVEQIGQNVLWVRGQCVEQRRDAEPYLPVLEALHQLCRSPLGQRVVDILRRYAPTWLVQMPWVLSAQDLDTLRQQLMGSGPERMLRELCIALEEVASLTPLVLVFEDLHWCDVASADWIAAMARRREPARLLLIGSLRTGGNGSGTHPIQELLPALTTRACASEIRLEALAPDAVRAYVTGRLDERAPKALLDAIERHSGGSPLFLVTALGYVLSRNWIVKKEDGWSLAIDAATLEAAVPTGLRELIETQVQGLAAEDRALLQAAAVAGVEVPVPALAVALGLPADELEAALDGLSRRFRFLRRTPNGSLSRFEFSHALYQQVLYAGAPATWRRQQHLEMARGLRAAYGDREAEVAAELALHCERGGAFEDAARYLSLAALNASQRVANREAAALLEQALRLIAQVEDSPRRQRREADLCIQLGAVRGVIHGRGAEHYLSPFLRAWDLGKQLDDVPRMFLARMAGFGHYSVTEQFGQAEDVCRDLMILAERAPLPDIVAVAHAAMGAVLCAVGRLLEAREHLERALATLNPHDPSTQLYRRLEDPEILCLTSLAWVLAQLGYIDQARRHSATATELGRQRAPIHYTYCLNASAILHLFLNDPEACRADAERTLELVQEHSFAGFLENATLLASWGREREDSRRGSWERLQADVDAYRRCNQRFGMVSYQVLVADACWREGAVRPGLAAIATAEAMMNGSGERAGAANLLRVKALLLDASGAGPGTVEACFQEALGLARANEHRLAELRVATDLAEWWHAHAQSGRAREVLEPVYAWFTEGLDAADLRRARALLDHLK